MSSRRSSATSAAWHDPPPRPPPDGLLGACTYETCGDADPMPDYDNVLTD